MNRLNFTLILFAGLTACAIQKGANVLVDFDTVQTNSDFHYFSNGHLTASSYSFRIVENPEPTQGDAPEGKVGELIKASDAKTFAGIYGDIAQGLDFSEHSILSIKVLMDHIGSFSVKLENSSTGGANVTLTQRNTKVGEWEELVFDFSNTLAVGHSYTRLTLFSDLHKKATGRDVTIWFDEIRLYGPAAKYSVDMDPAKGFRVVVLGSSTAEGIGTSVRDSAWVNKYRMHLKKSDKRNSVINLALGGYTTYHLLPTGAMIPEDRISPDTSRNVTAALKFNPDAVIINLPSNDTSKDYPVPEQLSNFRSLWKAFDDEGIPVWITTTQPRNYDDRKRGIQNVMKDSLMLIFDQHSIDFWDGFATDDYRLKEEFDSGDGVHMNDMGHAELVKRVIELNIPESTEK